MGKTTPCGGILAPSERGLSAKPTGGVPRGRQIAGNQDAPPLGHQSRPSRAMVSVTRQPHLNGDENRCYRGKIRKIVKIYCHNLTFRRISDMLVA